VRSFVKQYMNKQHIKATGKVTYVVALFLTPKLSRINEAGYASYRVERMHVWGSCNKTSPRVMISAATSGPPSFFLKCSHKLLSSTDSAKFNIFGIFLKKLRLFLFKFFK